MAATKPDQYSIEEKLVSFSLAMTYPIYFIGGLYFLGSAIGYLLLTIFLLRAYLLMERPKIYIPRVIWIWVIGMLLMLLALWIAHIDRELGFAKTIKSTIGWLKGWALLALFPLIGAVSNIRPSVISRGCCHIGVQTIIFAIFGIAVFAVGLSGELYVSPLKILGGTGPDFFQVRLFGINPETGYPRWPFFSPWAPAAGLLSCLYLIICLQEKNLLWRFLGIAGALTMCLLCQSRAGWAIFLLVIPGSFLLSRLHNPIAIVTAGLLVPILLLLGQPIVEMALGVYQDIRDSRPDSTRVRGTLARLAIEAWQHEAPIWGHGIVERGPKIVEHMPIGTHHTWYGLLYVKGLVGAISLAIPLILTIGYLLYESHRHTIAKAGLSIIIVLSLYSFFENLEILTYLYWPALIMIGIALNPANLKKRLHEKS